MAEHPAGVTTTYPPVPVYLGDVCLSSTHVYLAMSPEQLQRASVLFAHRAGKKTRGRAGNRSATCILPLYSSRPLVTSSMLRQKPEANSRNFRSLALPPRHASMPRGSLRASQSASVIASPPFRSWNCGKTPLASAAPLRRLLLSPPLGRILPDGKTRRNDHSPSGAAPASHLPWDKFTPTGKHEENRRPRLPLAHLPWLLTSSA
jgi:hypothetical protein